MSEAHSELPFLYAVTPVTLQLFFRGIQSFA